MPCNTPPPPEIDDFQDDPEDDILMYEVIGEDELYDLEEEMRDDSFATFSGHKDSVFCCKFNKSGNLAVSGGQGDDAFVWDPSNGVVKFECTGHSESVVAAAFSPDSRFVATADMNGVIEAFDTESGSRVFNYETAEISWIEWHNSSNLLFAGTTDGNCWKWSIPDEETCELFQTYGSGSSCGKILSDGSKCIVGYMDGSLRLWNWDEPSVIGSVTGPAAHNKSVTSVQFNQDGTLILSGSEDGTSKLIKSSNSKVLWDINCLSGAEGSSDESVESVAFFQGHPLVATGTNGGSLAIWDISTQVQRSTCNVKSAIVKLMCSSTSSLVYVGTSEDGVQLYDGRTAQLEKRWLGHNLGILDFDISEARNWLLTASDDHTCKVFDT